MPRRSVTDVARMPKARIERSRSSDIEPSRILIPLAFVALGGILVYALLQSFNRPPEDGRYEDDADSPAVARPTDGAQAATSASPGDDLHPEPSPEATLTPEEVLRRFVRASSSAARLVHSEPSYEKEALDGTPLASAQLQCRRLEPMNRIAVAGEEFMDHYFRAEFELESSRECTTLVAVRSRPGTEQEPKVLIDPLLDLIAGGRLETFASDPSQPQTTFRVILEAVPRRFDEKLQRVDPRIALRLRATTDKPEIAAAYLAKESPLADRLIALLDAPGPQYPRLKWGRREPATVILRWNPGKAGEPGSAAPPLRAPNEGAGPVADDTPSADRGNPAGAGNLEEMILGPVEGPAILDDIVETPATRDIRESVPASADTPFIELMGIRSLDWGP